MSKQWALLLWDDLDAQQDIKTQADTTLTFGVGGKDYELDLTRKHHEEFMSFIERYVAAARRADAPIVDHHGRGPASGGMGGPRSPERRQFLADLRTWADSEGRSAEYQGKRDPKLYSYKRGLVKDYEAWLERQAAKDHAA